MRLKAYPLILSSLLLAGCSKELIFSEENNKNEIIPASGNIVELKDDKEYEVPYNPYVLIEEKRNNVAPEETSSADDKEEVETISANISASNDEELPRKQNILEDDTATKDKTSLIPDNADIHFILQEMDDELGGFSRGTDDFYIDTENRTLYYIEGYEALQGKDSDVNRYRRFENILTDDDYTHVMTEYLETFADAKRTSEYNIDAEYAPYVSEDGTLYFYNNELYKEFKHLAGF